MKSFVQSLIQKLRSNNAPENLIKDLALFASSYLEAAAKGGNDISGERSFTEYCQLFKKELETPFDFEHYHPLIESYREFSLNYFRNITDIKKSTILGEDNLNIINEKLLKKENVFLLANHQTEGDPQLIQLLIEKKFPKLAKEMIFVAGHRVTSDIIAKPFSIGCNLLCIYSKKHIEHPPEKRSEKLAHNQNTMKEMRRLLEEGGKCIYIAPSGGRDRMQDNRYLPAPFDPPSLEMTLLQGKRVTTPTHFFPLALWTYPLLPPPKIRQKELGENRKFGYSPAHLAFGQQVDTRALPGEEIEDKKLRRKARADFIWQKVYEDYQRLEALAEGGPAL